jgi:uncharacterized membrane protein
MNTRTLVYGGMLAAAYAVLTWALAPLSYGPLQFRVSEILKPAALFHPSFALAFGVGNGISNLMSPFGAWDYVAMSLVNVAASLLCWRLRRWPVPAVLAQAVVISAGVAVFPLGIAGGFPILPTFFAVLVSEVILLVAGYFVIWRRYGAQILRLPAPGYNQPQSFV